MSIEEQQIREMWDRFMEQMEVVIVPDKNDVKNLDKAMVYIVKKYDPYEEGFLKLKIRE